MEYVYFLRSRSRPAKTYIGSTSDLRKRLGEHNDGLSVHTAKFRPWELIAYVAVADRVTAESLEKYFKSDSGHAFWHKRFLPRPTKPQA